MPFIALLVLGLLLAVVGAGLASAALPEQIARRGQGMPRSPANDRRLLSSTGFRNRP